MRLFNTELYKKKIVMLSDYEDPSSYNKIELEEETKLIEDIRQQIAEYKIPFVYLEFKTLSEIKEYLKNLNPDEVVVFNWCEKVDGKENTAHLVTEVLENMKFIFTGADSACLKMTGNKKVTKDILVKENIRTPDYAEITKLDELDTISVNYPLIVKLSNMHSSTGLNKDNVVENIADLRNIADKMLKEFNSPLLLEEYIEGDEYTVPVWGNGNKVEILSICKIDFKDRTVSSIQTEESKFNPNSIEYINSSCKYLPKNEIIELGNFVSDDIIKAYKVLGFEDYGRFEIRVRDSESYIIDANANPALCYDNSFFGSTKLQGYNSGETIMKICEFALLRNN